MIIQELSLSDYRNYEELSLSFSPGTNILFGDNAQGKTNILEAIYLCATTRSHRGARDREIIRFGHEEGHLRILTDRDGATYRTDIHLRAGKAKGIAVDGTRLKRASDLVGRLLVVLFAPEDLAIVKNGPAERRRFMDMELCQLDPVYLANLTRYNRLLAERAKLLKELCDHPEHTLLLEVQDKQLIEYGASIIRTRAEFLRQVDEIIGPVHRQLTGGQEELTIRYEPCCSAEELADRIPAAHRRDIALGQTSVGPHKDDFSFLLKGEGESTQQLLDLRRFGSQGQQRSASLSLKLSEIEIVRRDKKENPVLLLDDVLSELDRHRQKQLLSAIGDIQTIITCTGLDDLVDARLSIDRVYQVEKGTVKEFSEKTTMEQPHE
ncbi:MAG: DNA replication/repair protein RecF [Butyrivibrio sp.]|nr:DNA replication/repair protein RecF [Butyrivibrio sp.]